VIFGVDDSSTVIKFLCQHGSTFGAAMLKPKPGFAYGGVFTPLQDGREDRRDHLPDKFVSFISTLTIVFI
jgi:hypothetical protein